MQQILDLCNRFFGSWGWAGARWLARLQVGQRLVGLADFRMAGAEPARAQSGTFFLDGFDAGVGGWLDRALVSALLGCEFGFEFDAARVLWPEAAGFCPGELLSRIRVVPSIRTSGG